MGLADRLRAEGRAVVGPGATGAQIEASKAYSKDLMVRAGVPSAPSRTFTALEPALAYVSTHAEPLVVKASGLAAGKGAVVCQTRAEASAALRAMLGDRIFGDAGQIVVIEQFMPGEELSVLALTNGTEVQLLPAAQDHKRIGEGDTGPNTGGMGAYAPVALATPALLERTRREVLLPTLRQLAIEGAPYRGVQLPPGRSRDPGGAPSGIRRADRLLRSSSRGTASDTSGDRQRRRGHHRIGGAGIPRSTRDRSGHHAPVRSAGGSDRIPRGYRAAR
jgi:phosphoribosylamine--glycine ligase